MKHTRFIISVAGTGLLLSSLLTAAALEGAPIAQNMELKTYRGISMEGQLHATDPEGDAITFQLTTPPIKGEVLLTEDGSFVYTPQENRRGKDYFGYTATDSNGNVSQEATVIISLVKAKTTVTYADLKGCGGYYDALRLSEAGVFTAEQIGTEYIFSPGTAVTRGEFLAMCMELNRQPLVTAVGSTGFLDDSTIPTWQKPYVATALMTGKISGTDEHGTAVFNAASPISCAQAAVMISDVFSLSNVAVMDSSPHTEPYAAQAIANLTACNILPEHCDTTQTLTRGMAADLLSAAMDVLEKR